MSPTVQLMTPTMGGVIYNKGLSNLVLSIHDKF